MPNRHRSTDDYRYGFNGKEKDDEIKGEGTQYDYGFRIYDPRIGKFLSRDPLAKNFPWYTPYQFAGNKPIHCVDLDGNEELFFVTYTEKLIFGTNYIERTTKGFVERAVNDASALAQSLKTSIEEVIDPTSATLTTVNPNVALENMERELQKVNQMAEGVPLLIDEYCDLIDKASKGNPEAIGGVLYEASILLIPIGEGIKAEEAVVKAESAEAKLEVTIGKVEDVDTKISENNSKNLNKNSNAAESHFILYQIHDGDTEVHSGLMLHGA